MQKSTFLPARRKVLGVLGAALILPRTAFGGELAATSGRAFGTTWKLVADGGADLAPIGPSIERLFAEIDRCFSPWRSESTITRFNRMPAGRPVRDTELAYVTEKALVIAKQSAGAFDPTVGPLVARWGFGPIHEGSAPDWRGLTTSNGTVSKTRDDLTLDLCGIAKGWALDRAAECVEAAGIDSFLFELGGEILARGEHPDGRDWHVAVDTPGMLTDSSPAIRLPSGSAVATSGLWMQSYQLTGRLYGHIIDTGTTEPVSDALRSVTVVADDAMSADGWATALCAAGEQAGPALARSLGIAALFLIEDGDALRYVKTGKMHEMLL